MRFVLILLAIAVGWYVWKLYRRERIRVRGEFDEVRRLPADMLERDPETGRYRPKDES